MLCLRRGDKRGCACSVRLAVMVVLHSKTLEEEMKLDFVFNVALAAANLSFYVTGRKWYNLVIGLLCAFAAVLLWRGL